MSTTPTEIAIYHNRMMPFYWMVAVAVTVMMGGMCFFNWNIACQVRELRDELRRIDQHERANQALIDHYHPIVDEYALEPTQ